MHNAELIDIDGDGYPDLLHRPGTFWDGVPSGKWVWWKNMGNNTFGAQQEIVNPPPINWFDDPRVKIADLNGDGLPDFLWYYASESAGGWPYINLNISWWANTGNGRFRNPGGAVPSPCGTSARFADGSAAPLPANCHPNLGFVKVLATAAVDVQWKVGVTHDAVRLADFNGDGLVDFAVVEGGRDVDCLAPIVECFAPVWTYFPLMTTTTGVGLAYGSGVQMKNPFGFFASPPYHPFSPDEGMDLLDVNGDGLIDILVSKEGEAPKFYPGISPSEFGNPVSLLGGSIGNGPITRDKNKTLSDMDGDGFVDIVKGPTFNGTAVLTNYAYDKVVHSPVKLLQKVTDSRGGSQTVGYERKRINTGGARWVVSQLVTDDGLGLKSLNDYDYADGISAFWPHNEFRGFRFVKKTDSPDEAGLRSYTKTFFHQDDAKKGRVDVAFSFDGADALYSRLDPSYTVPATFAGVTRVDLAKTILTTWDGKGGAGRDKVTQFRNYDQYGQARLVEVGGSSNIVSTPPEFTVTQFVYNTGAYIVNRPKNVDVYRSSITPEHRIRGTAFGYDGRALGFVPNKGDMTRRVDVLLSGIAPDPEILYSYDSFGNRIGTIEPLKNKCSTTGFSTKVDYDPVFATYPLKVTNAQCQETISTYWGINATLNPQGLGAYSVPGLLASVTDPNGVTSESYWDVLGRPVATVVPPDSSASPTTYFVYSVPGTAPSTVQTFHRRTAGQVSVSSQYSYSDGLGRIIQTKREGEKAGTWITVDTRYNNRGLVEQSSVPYLTTSLAYSAAGAVPGTTTFYDAAQRPTMVVSPDKSIITTDYNQWTTTTTDAKGAKTVRHFGRLGQLTAIQEAAGGGFTTYAETDLSGKITQTIRDDEGNEIKTTFDSLGRKIVSSDPDRGLLRYQYDANGNLRIRTDAKGQETRFLYDDLNRVQVKTSLDAQGNTESGSTVNYQYDDATAGANRIGRLWQVGDDIGFTTISYDARGSETRVEKLFWDGAARNLAPNPGFENGVGFPFDWSGSGMGAFVVDGATAHSGSRSMSITNPAPSMDFVNTWQPYDAAKSYTADAWIKTSSLTKASAKVKFVFQDANSVETGSKYTSSGISATVDWRKVSASLAAGAAPAGTAFIRVGVEAVTSATAAAGPTWSLTPVDSSVTDGDLVSSAIDGAGNIHVGYYNRGALMYAKWDSSSSNWTTQSVDTGVSKGAHFSIAVDSGGNPHISYGTYYGSVKYAKWTGTAWAIETVATDAANSYRGYSSRAFSSMALDSADNPHISYMHKSNQALMYASWTGTTWVIETVDSTTTGNLGQHPSLALDSADNPHISYYDWSNRAVKYARRNGTAWAVETVDSRPGGKAGFYPSLALDGAGKPHIAYYVNSYPIYEMRYASLNGGSWDIETVESVGSFGNKATPSLVVDAAGNPHIAYLDQGAKDLKYARSDGNTSPIWNIETVDPDRVTVGMALSLDNSGQPHITYTSGSWWSPNLRHAALGGEGASGTAWFDDITLADGSSGPITYTTGYSYDSLGRLVTMTYPDGEVVRRTYNNQGLLETLASDTHGMQYINNLDYNPLGSVVYRKTGNGVGTDYTYYPGNFRLHTLKTTSAPAAGGQIHQDLTYAYDNNGNVESIVDALAGSRSRSSQVFGYDELNRLISASSAAFWSTYSYTYTYDYDSLGRMRSGAGITYKYPPAIVGVPNPLVPTHPHAPTSDGSNNYSYDINGNLVSRGSRHFTWNTDGHLIKVADGGTTLLENHYDFAGKRVMKLEGSITTRIPFPHYRTVDGVATKFYFANGQRIAERTGSSVDDVSFYFGDHLGSSNAVLDWNANEIKNTLFYPYGGILAESVNKVLVHQFTGQEKDRSTGLYNYGARFYDTALRHFISADTMMDAGDPQTFNRYSYVRNNPLTLVDPTGNEAAVFTGGTVYRGSHFTKDGLVLRPPGVGLFDFGGRSVLTSFQFGGYAFTTSLLSPAGAIASGFGVGRDIVFGDNTPSQVLNKALTRNVFLFGDGLIGAASDLSIVLKSSFSAALGEATNQFNNAFIDRTGVDSLGRIARNLGISTTVNIPFFSLRPTNKILSKVGRGQTGFGVKTGLGEFFDEFDIEDFGFAFQGSYLRFTGFSSTGNDRLGNDSFGSNASVLRNNSDIDLRLQCGVCSSQ